MTLKWQRVNTLCLTRKLFDCRCVLVVSVPCRIRFGQGYASMNWPTKKLEELVLGGKLAHGGNSVLRWMASNVSIETDAADNWKPSKKKSPERIDGIVALIMALDRATTCAAPFKSIYETRGALSF